MRPLNRAGKCAAILATSVLKLHGSEASLSVAL
jgi:hypothetical protein